MPLYSMFSNIHGWDHISFYIAGTIQKLRWLRFCVTVLGNHSSEGNISFGWRKWCSGINYYISYCCGFVKLNGTAFIVFFIHPLHSFIHSFISCSCCCCVCFCMRSEPELFSMVPYSPQHVYCFWVDEWRLSYSVFVCLWGECWVEVLLLRSEVHGLQTVNKSLALVLMATQPIETSFKEEIQNCLEQFHSTLEGKLVLLAIMNEFTIQHFCPRPRDNYLFISVYAASLFMTVCLRWMPQFLQGDREHLIRLVWRWDPWTSFMCVRKRSTASS